MTAPDPTSPERNGGRGQRSVLAALGLTVAAVIVLAWLPSSFRAPVQGPLPLPPDSACADRPYAWARQDTAEATPPAGDPDSSSSVFRADSVRMTGVSFAPGSPSQVVWSGILRNGTGSTIEIRGYHVDYLSPSGAIVGNSSCRVSMGGEQCGVHGTNLKRPGELALIADTLKSVPPAADRDTARIFWAYCIAPREIQ